MADRRAQSWSRREFVAALTAVGTAGVLGVRPADAEPPPETTRLKLVKIPSICQAPQYVADALLKAEGFTDVEYVQKAGALGITEALAAGEANINNHFVAPSIIRVEAGDPIVFLGGLHIGCFELFGTDRIHGIRDLKGKTVGVLELGSSQHLFVSTMAAHVGLDPHRDIHWVTNPPAESMRLLAAGQIDAFLGFPPEPLSRFPLRSVDGIGPPWQPDGRTRASARVRTARAARWASSGWAPSRGLLRDGIQFDESNGDFPLPHEHGEEGGRLSLGHPEVTPECGRTHRAVSPQALEDFGVGLLPPINHPVTS